MLVRTLPEFAFLFFAYSFMGWSMEMLYKGIELRKAVNRGFLVGPYCPIYGFALVTITILFQRSPINPLLTFLLIVAFCSTLEYAVSYLMERIFHKRWWDYYDKKFNLNGRICLPIVLFFGVAGSSALYFINPVLMRIFHFLPIDLANKILVCFAILFLADLTVSIRVILSISLPRSDLDCTPEISKRVWESLTKRSKK